MANLLLIKPEITKRRRAKLRWKIVCGVLSLIIVLENLCIAYLMYGR